MRTFHLSSLPRDPKTRKGKAGLLPKNAKPRKIQLDGKEAYRIRLNSRQARKLRRAGETLIQP